MHVATLRIHRQRQPARSGAFTLTHDALERMAQRGIRHAAVEAALAHGRATFPDGRAACYFAIGHREVRSAAARGLDLRAHEGVTVVTCSLTRAVLTVFRNRDFSGHGRRQRHGYVPGRTPRVNLAAR